MEKSRRLPLETLQLAAARLIATSPAGEGLPLVGGLRYRLLDGSCRTSLDIDYHWDGDLEKKRDEILRVLKKKLLPELKRRFGYDSTAEPFAGPGADSPALQALALAFFKPEVPGSRVELPIEVTRIACLDRPIVRTAGGTVFLTASDADMVESKAIAVLQRVFIQDRDLLDLFLFQDALVPEAGSRLERKLSMLSVAAEAVEERLAELRKSLDVHCRGVDRIIEQQVDGPAAANLRKAGGGRMICETALALLEKVLGSG